jgi:hypothetical protein
MLIHLLVLCVQVVSFFTCLRVTQHNFHCGHVIAEANGGRIHVENLRPICSVYNNSMGTMNMKEFALESFEISVEI